MQASTCMYMYMNIIFHKKKKSFELKSRAQGYKGRSLKAFLNLNFLELTFLWIKGWDF